MGSGIETINAPKVFIILVNWNGWQDTIECLQSLEVLDYPNREVVVVDNGSTDQSVQKIRTEHPDVTLIESKENRGFAGGNNLGINYAVVKDADYCWLLNNDTVVEKGALFALVDRIERDPAIGICGSKLVYYHQRDTIQALAGGTYNKWLGVSIKIGGQVSADSEIEPAEVEEQLDFIIGASMLVSREFIREVGLLNEEYFLYYEEIDWATRAEGKFKLGFAPESIVYHKEGASIGGRQNQPAEKSRKSDYYQLKNRLKFTATFYPLYLPVVYGTVILAIFNRILRGQWNRIPMIIKLMFSFNK
jgi:GT2 family glycosyltransferase